MSAELVYLRQSSTRDILLCSEMLLPYMEENDNRTYELGFLLAPTVAEAHVPALVETLTQAITSAGGTVHASGAPEFIDLAYTMERHIASKRAKYSQAYFGWIKFDTAPESLVGLKKTFDGMADLIRYILVKTSVENTVVFKKPKMEARRDFSTGLEEVLVEDEAVAEEAPADVLEHEKLPDLAEEAAATTTSSEEAAQ